MLTTRELTEREPDGDIEETLSGSERRELFLLAREALNSRQLAEARQILHGLVVLSRDDVQAWTLLAEVEVADGKLEDARDAYQFALSLGESELAPALRLAELEAQLGETRRAWRRATWIATQYQLDDDARSRVARLLANPGAAS